MKLKAGKYYRAQDGSVHGPMKKDSANENEFGTFGEYWQADGRWMRNGMDCPRDLITEVRVTDVKPKKKKVKK